MAPVSNKRARAAAASTEAKKAKIVDPIAVKIEQISKTISDPECKLQDSHREMVLMAIPHTLTVPSEERHEYQSKVAQMVGQVLNDYVAQWKQEVSDSKDNIIASAQKADQALKLVEESAGKMNDQEEDVKKCKDVVHEDSEALHAAEEALKLASKEVAEFDENLQMTIAQKDECNSIYNEYFVPLKSGGVDAKEIARFMKTVQPMLKKLSTESSLLTAIAPAFKKSPDERGAFDNMAIEGAEGMFTKQLGELQELIDKADTTKAEKVSTETLSQETLKAATEKRTASEHALKAAEAELAALETKHADLLAAMNAADKANAASEAVVATKEGRLNEAQLALSTFTELLERQSAMPESAADVHMVDKLEAVSESSPMQPAVIA